MKRMKRIAITLALLMGVGVAFAAETGPAEEPASSGTNWYWCPPLCP